MDAQELQNIIAAGENDRVEFKRCGNQPEKDLFESICAFANTFGGSILLGVEDNGGLCCPYLGTSSTFSTTPMPSTCPLP